MFNWLRKKLGYHVCEEFTQWKTYKGTYERQATRQEVIWNGVSVVAFTKRWQERCCTICSKIQQRSLDQ